MKALRFATYICAVLVGIFMLAIIFWPIQNADEPEVDWEKDEIGYLSPDARPTFSSMDISDITIDPGIVRRRSDYGPFGVMQLEAALMVLMEDYVVRHTLHERYFEKRINEESKARLKKMQQLLKRMKGKS